MVATRLLKEPNDKLTIRKTIKSSLAVQFIKAELSGQLYSAAAVVASDRQLSRRAGEPGPTVKKAQKEAEPLIREILAAADLGHLPIIVVPSAASTKSRVTTLNAERFLQSGQYEEPNPRTMPRPASLPLIVERLVAGRTLRFRVYDDTSKFKKEDWKSCVAVFAEGKKWQFSGWPFKTEADLFYSVRGFFVKYLDEPLEASLSQWNILTLNLRREGRHQDASVAAEFWRAVESFLMQPRMRRFSASNKL
jgi:RNA pol II accessory factor, Cdc73 family, C-terminal